MKKLRYQIEAIILKALIFFFSCFSIDHASAMAAGIGRFIGPYLGVSNIARKNMQNVMPELSNDQIEKIVTKMWDNLLRVSVEFSFVNKMSEQELAKRMSYSGLEHLADLKANPAIVFSGHFGNWELGPRIISRFASVAVVYRKSNNHIVDKMINKLREFNDITTIPKGKEGVRQLLNALKHGRSIAMLVDQKMDNGMSIPFFGRAAMTTDAIARFALDYDRPIIPMYIKRLTGVNFELKVFPALTIHKTEDKTEDMRNILTQINLQLEEWIRETPEQWFWLHRRWPK